MRHLKAFKSSIFITIATQLTYIYWDPFQNLITYYILILILLCFLVQEQYSGTLTQRKKEGVSGQSLDPKQAESLPPKPKVRTIIFLSVFLQIVLHKFGASYYHNTTELDGYFKNR